nr:ribonuclease H-like domain-containing protein [Tanacetum cinerariifolium]
MDINWTRSCADVVAFACVIEIWLLKTCLGSEGYAYPVFVYLLEQMGTPTLVWIPVCAIGFVRDLGFGCDLGHHSRRGKRPREDNDEHVDDLNGQENDQGMEANEGVEGVNMNVAGVNEGVGGAPDFSTIIAQQLQNLLPAMLTQSHRYTVYRVLRYRVSYNSFDNSFHSRDLKDIEFRFRIDSKFSNKVSVMVVLGLSKVANPLYCLRDKDLFKSKDPQVEVILNGDSPSPTRIVDEAVQIIPPTTANQSVSAASSKATVSTLPNVDSRSDAVIYSFFASQSNSPQLDNEDLKQIDPDDLEEMDLKWECRSPRDNKNKEATRKHVPTEVSTLNTLVSQCDAVGGYDWSFQPEEEPTNYELMAYALSGSLSSSRLDNETSSKNISKLLESQVSDKTSLGFDSQVFNSQVFDCEEVHSHESDNIVPKSPENDRYKTCEGYHVVPPPYIGTFMPLKLDLVFNNAPNASKTVASVFNVESSTNKPSKDMFKTNTSDAPIIEDWISDSKDETENEYVPKQTEPSFVPTSEHVKTPRESVKKIQVSHGLGPQKTLSFLFDVHGNPQQALKDKGVIESGCSRHMTGNISFLSDFKEINGDMLHLEGILEVELKFNLFSVSQMCDKKNSVLFIDTKCVVLSSDYKLPNENHVLLRVPRENNMYNVDLKNVVPSRDLTCIFTKATLDESNL